MLSFSEKHGPKHAKVQGKFSSAWTGATPLTILQIWKLIKHAAISKSHSAPRTVPKKTNIPNSQAVWQQSTLLFCLQEQNHIEMAEKNLLFMQSGNLRIWFHSNADWNQHFYTFSA